jgi:hypothetical protein
MFVNKIALFQVFEDEVRINSDRLALFETIRIACFPGGLRRRHRSKIIEQSNLSV